MKRPSQVIADAANKENPVKVPKLDDADYWRGKYNGQRHDYDTLKSDYLINIANYQAFRWETDEAIDQLEDELTCKVNEVDIKIKELASADSQIKELEDQVRRLTCYKIRNMRCGMK